MAANDSNMFITEEEVPLDKRKLPLLLKIFGLLCVVGGVAVIPMIAFLTVVIVALLRQEEIPNTTIVSIVITAVVAFILLVVVALFILLGVRLLRNKRHNAAQTAEVLIGFVVVAIIGNVMLTGINGNLILYGIILALLIALVSYVDPSLAQERELRRKLRSLDDRERAEEGTLGRDETGKGYISLNFFNLFWIFVVCCVLGLIIETIYHVVVVDPGHYQDRAGMLFGPFSPIYGFGGLLMTIALNRFHNKPVLVIFLLSALIGGAFEYLTSWFMEYAFGAVAWDYTGTFLSIDGRTNGIFMAMWGFLGVVWVKLLLPWMLKLVNLIPWNLRYTITTVCAVLMIADGVMTLQSLDCWYGRLAGEAVQTPVEQFYAKNFDNAYMANRFQSMEIHPENAVRAD